MSILTSISEDLCLDENYIKNIINNSNYYYRKFNIPKKNGGERTIYQPSAELKTLQYWTLRNIFSKLPVSQSAYAYCKGKSIVDNAKKHQENKFILHTDICNFFESISRKHIQDILKKNALCFDKWDFLVSTEVDTICKICLLNNQMTIGAVSSPHISNVIFYEIDQKIENYCKNNKYKYSRYADDIYISSKNYLPREIIGQISQYLFESHFKINYEKTRFMSMKKKRVITGIVLTSKKNLSIGLKRKQNLKKDIYNFLQKNQGNAAKIKGYLAFLKNVEPLYYDNIIIKYIKYGNMSKLL